MRPTLRLLEVDANGSGSRVLTCIRCKLTIRYSDSHARIVSDLLASHWADDHHLPGWRDAAAEARDRLWRRHPDLLEKLTSMSGSGGTHDRAS
jgi:predicted molibdopterin-dependent oxidoreductase YjgC